MTSKRTLFELDMTKKESQKQKLKTISWIASFISFLGIIFNAYQMVICWPIWCIANLFWIYWAWKKQEWAQVFLWIVFTLANLYGWYVWVFILI